MLIFIKGIGCLLATLIVFSLFSMKFPKGDKAMGGLANAAVATFLVEAIYKYIGGDFLGFSLLGEVGSVAGTMGGVAAGILVPIGMGLNPVYAVAVGVAVGGFGILPGFVAGYVCYFIIKKIDEKLPPGVDVIVATLLSAVIAREIAILVDPGITALIANIGDVIELTNKTIKSTETVPSGRVLVDGLGVGDVGGVVLRDRKHLADDGIIIITLTMDSATGEVVSGPDIVSRGFVYVKESEQLINEITVVAEDIIENCYIKRVRDWNTIKLRLRDGVSKHLYETTRRSPMVLPIIMEI